MALPPGLSPKSVTVGIASFTDGSLASGTATITAPVNLVHTPTNRPIFSSSMTQPFVDGAVTFTLLPTDAPGLNRFDWTYKLNVQISGALVQPDPIWFTLPSAGPDTIDLDGLVTVPSSAGVPISVDVLTVSDITNPASDAGVALRAALGSPAATYTYELAPDGTKRIKTETKGAVTMTYTYDDANGGRVKTQSDGTTTWTFNYDADSLITGVAA